MTAEPDPHLTASMLQRASDLAAYMLQRGILVEVASGTSANGHPCTVIIAIGEWAEPVREAGAKIVGVIADESSQAHNKAIKN